MSSEGTEFTISQEQFNQMMYDVVAAFKRDVFPSIENSLEEKIYKKIVERLKDDITKIILATRGLKTSDIVTSLSPKTKISEVVEWRGKRFILDFFRNLGVVRLEHIYIREVSYETVENSDLPEEDKKLIFKSLKIRGYELRKECNEL